MANRSRRWHRWVALATVAAATWAFLWPTEPDRVVKRVAELGHALAVASGERREAREARITQALGEYVVPGVKVEVPDLPAGDLAMVAARLGERYEEARVEVEQPNVRIDASGAQAEVYARVLLAGRSAATGLVTDTRELHLILRRIDGRWRISALRASGPSHVEPEPRP